MRRVATPQRCSVRRSVCLRICGKCRAAFRRVACCASALSSYLSAITRLPSGTSPSQLRAIFAPSALFPGISRRCTRRSVASVRARRRPSVARLPYGAPSARRYGPFGLGRNTARRRPSPSRRRLMRPGIRALSGLLSRFTSLCRAVRRESPVHCCGATAPYGRARRGECAMKVLMTLIAQTIGRAQGKA